MLFKNQKERYKEAFFIAFAVAFAFFIPFILSDKGYFLFYGDFNVQQVPFYKLAHNAVRSGEIFWNWNTDLGANFIGSYSFYLLGSPFFWLTLPFPNSVVPYLMGPLLMLKFACSSLTAYCYLRRFCKNKDNALIGALLYAFSGFSVYNVFFNHFHEAIVFFPLLLLSLEELVCENRRGFFAVVVFFTSLSNYYFFIGMLVFLFIYWIVRTLSGCWDMKIGTFAKILFEGVLGCGLACVILLPSFYSVIQNNRVSGYPTGWNAILYGQNQRFLNVIQCFFFPPDNPARPVFFPNADAKWSSQAGWLPLMGMTGVIAWLQNRRKTWQRRMIITLLFMALIPVLNSAFQLFNWAYYARWFYMLVLMMALVTAQSLDDADIEWGSAFRWGVGAVIAFTAVIGFYPSERDEMKPTEFGLFNKDGTFYAKRFWAECIVAIGCAILLIMLFAYRGSIFQKKKPKSRGELLYVLKKNASVFTTITVCLISVVTIAYAGLFIYWGKQSSHDTRGYLIPDLIETDFTLEDSDTYRIDVYDGVDNTGMFLGIPTIQAFHSIVPGSVMDYYPYVGIDRGVATRPDTSVYAIRSFLNCRYLVDSTKNGGDFGKDKTMSGWRYVETKNNFDVWENNYYIPYGFTYDYCITEKTVENNYQTSNKALVMLKAMIVSDEQAEKFSEVLPSVETLPNEDFSENGYMVDCIDRRETSLNNSFSIDKNGFTSGVNLDRENYVFYSVPYEDGWTAYVDGKQTEIEKVNVGFMAVKVGAGEHTVRFRYVAPGLKLGTVATLGSALVFVVYLILWSLYKRKYPERCKVVYPEGKKLAAKWEEEDRLIAEYEESLMAEAEVSDCTSVPDMFEVSEETPAEVNDKDDPLKIQDGFDESEVK